MTPEQIVKRRDVMRVIADHCVIDMVRREGKPFNGQTVGEAFGEICGQLEAVARALGDVLDHLVQIGGAE
jgi:hypothetical protein